VLGFAGFDLLFEADLQLGQKRQIDADGPSSVVAVSLRWRRPSTIFSSTTAAS
jgi:hypothetical protein